MINLLKDYASKRIELLKLEATEKTALTAGTITFVLLMVIAGLFFLLFFNIGIGLLIGYYIGNYAWGVLIVAGFYLLLLFLVMAMRKSISNMVVNTILKSLN